jgi:hypothetical protein
MRSFESACWSRRNLLRVREEDPRETTDVALSGVTAIERIWSIGFGETSWIESTAPSEETQRRGRSRSLPALRAHSIDGIGATSTSPARSFRASSTGTPWTSSTSASSRWKTGAMFT